MTTVDTAALAGGDSRRLSAYLGLGLEALLCGKPVSWTRRLSGWDAWWVTVRSNGRLVPESDMGGTCRSCREAARSGLPTAASQLSCDCFERWARALEASEQAWRLPQRLTVAMITPGVADAPIRARLRGRFRAVKDLTRRLRAHDVVRLMPRAHGEDLRAATARLTGGLVRVLVLHGGEHAIADGLAIRQVVRAQLGDEAYDGLCVPATPADALAYDGLCVPATPADALADVEILAGRSVLEDQYQRRVRNDPRGTSARIGAYQACIGPGSAEVIPLSARQRT